MTVFDLTCLLCFAYTAFSLGRLSDSGAFRVCLVPCAESKVGHIAAGLSSLPLSPPTVSAGI